MRLAPTELIGFEINERLRLTELIEERPFAYFYHAQVLALSRVVGTCTVTVYIPSGKGDPDEVCGELRSIGRSGSNEYLYGVQEVGTLRHPGLGRIIYSTGEPITTTLSGEIAAGTFVGWEVGEPVVCNVARALLDHHGKGLVHGRIRPYHLLKTSDGWKLTGHAESQLEDRFERLNRFPEEPVYLPPENYRRGLYSTAVDAWALGVCLHKASCGRVPYPESGDLLEEVVKNPPRVERPPGRFGSVVRGLLNQEPEERWDMQRAIDHIERPRGGAFQSGGPEGGSSPGEQPVQEKTEQVPMAEPPRPQIDRPLFARFGFLGVCLLCFAVTTYVGFTTAKLPKIPKLNAPPEPLYSVDFSHSRVDPDGRLITNIPEQAVAYSETLPNDVRLEMVQVPPGAFAMGSDLNEPHGEGSERPRHQVEVGGFYISRFEVTQRQWAAVANLPQVREELPPSPSQFRGPDRPVEGVTWLQAKEFCERLSRATGRYYRLPTEAEWEFACRAGTQSPFSFGQTINSALANYQATKPYAQEGVGEYRKQTLPVGSLGAANYFGLVDMHGNVAEWCEDHFGDYTEEFQRDPTGPEKGHTRVVRGGSWRSLPWQVRSAVRVGVQEAIRRNDIGFRVVLPRVVMVDPPKS